MRETRLAFEPARGDFGSAGAPQRQRSARLNWMLDLVRCAVRDLDVATYTRCRVEGVVTRLGRDA
jgi:hypothetical protein